jgi:hypothetical protein
MGTEKAVSVSRVLMVRLFLSEGEDVLEFDCKVIKGRWVGAGPEATGMVRAMWMHSRDKNGNVYSIGNLEERWNEAKFIDV